MMQRLDFVESFMQNEWMMHTLEYVLTSAVHWFYIGEKGIFLFFNLLSSNVRINAKRDLLLKKN